MQGEGKITKSCTRIFCFRFGLYILLLLLFLIQPFQSVFDSGDAQAVLIYWSNRNGTADDFDWQNGGSANGLFGNPSLVNGNILHFSPQNFLAESINGKSAFATDLLKVDIIVHSGKKIEGIRIIECGDFNVPSGGNVSVSAGIFAANLNQNETRNTFFKMNISDPCIDFWNGQAVIEELNWTYLRITLNNNLTARNPSGLDTSFISKTSFDIEIITPEPATIVILTLGIFLLPLFSRKINTAKSAVAGLAPQNKKESFFRI
ncbi:MAG: hypothetical protein WC496_00830 [Phycisphaerae bacterium]|jgi:hypothetical protein